MAWELTVGGKTTKYNTRKEYAKAVKKYRDSGYNIQNRGNGNVVALSPQKKLTKPKSKLVVNLRRNNYNETAKRYGFNSRDEVRSLLRNLKSLGYTIGDYGVKGVDGYMGGMTLSAYLNAWEKYPELMEAWGYKRPDTPGVGTIKVGNREVVDTDLNRAVAERVRNADEWVNENYGADRLFTTYFLGADKLLMPTQMYGAIRQLSDPNIPIEEFVNNWFTNYNNGIFEGWDTGMLWAEEHPRAASMINTAGDILFSRGFKAGPKLRSGAKSVASNIKNRAILSASATTPRLRVSEHIGGSTSAPRGNLKILMSEMENVAARPGTFVTSGVKANGHINGTNRGLAGSVNLTPVYETVHFAPSNTISAMANTPGGSGMYIFPYHIPNTGTLSGLGGTSAGEYLIGGEAPYLETWYREPVEYPDATKFYNGGSIRHWNE